MHGVQERFNEITICICKVQYVYTYVYSGWDQIYLHRQVTIKCFNFLFHVHIIIMYNVNNIHIDNYMKRKLSLHVYKVLAILKCVVSLL